MRAICKQVASVLLVNCNLEDSPGCESRCFVFPFRTVHKSSRLRLTRCLHLSLRKHDVGKEVRVQ